MNTTLIGIILGCIVAFSTYNFPPDDVEVPNEAYQLVKRYEEVSKYNVDVAVKSIEASIQAGNSH